MANGTYSRDDVLNRLTRVFRDEGYDAASLARLSKATGLGRASLYHHFPGGKAEMALAVVERSNALFGEKVIELLKRKTAPRQRIVEMVRNLDAYYCSGTESCLLGVFAMSETPSPINDHVRKGLTDWIDALAGTLLDAGLSRSAARAHAEDAVCQIQGALLLTRAIGNPAPFMRMLKSLETELLPPELLPQSRAA